MPAARTYLLYWVDMNPLRFACRSGGFCLLMVSVTGCTERSYYSGDNPGMRPGSGDLGGAFFVVIIIFNEFGLLVRQVYETTGLKFPAHAATDPANSITVSELNRLTDASKQGDAVAQNDFGSCYFSGRGVVQNRVLAADWYRRSADQGYAKAQHNLAMCYEHGEGVPPDALEAYAYYRVASTTVVADRAKVTSMELGMTPEVRQRTQAHAEQLQQKINLRMAEQKAQAPAR